MPALIPLLLGLAPTVAQWVLGDTAGKAAEKVAGIAREVLGTDDPSGIERALAADPAAALQFKVALLAAQTEATRLEKDAEKAARQAELEELKAHLTDVQSARSQTVELAKSGSVISWGAPVVSVLAVGVFAGFVYLMFIQSVPDGMKEALMLMAGSAAAGFGAAGTFFFTGTFFLAGAAPGAAAAGAAAAGASASDPPAPITRARTSASWVSSRDTCRRTAASSSSRTKPSRPAARSTSVRTSPTISSRFCVDCSRRLSVSACT